MNIELLTGELVRLTAEDPQINAETFSRWGRDSEYSRLLDNDPARTNSIVNIRKGIEKILEKDQINQTFFLVRARESDTLIGFVGLFGGFAPALGVVECLFDLVAAGMFVWLFLSKRRIPFFVIVGISLFQIIYGLIILQLGAYIVFSFLNALIAYCFVDLNRMEW
jgi:hypothetical protein